MTNSYQTWQDFLLDDDFIAWVNHPTAASDRRWQAWKEAHPAQRPLLEEAREVVLAARQHATDLSDAEAQVMWQQLQTRHRRKARSRTKIQWQIAASLSALLLMGGLLFWWTNTASTVTYRTAYGETKRIALPDGSYVMLNANSELSYSNNWEEKTERTVDLVGEAYFSVQPTEDHRKFMVQTSTVIVEVVGTSFNVNQRRGRARVVLDEGKVTLHRPNDERIAMQPGDLVEISENDFVKKQVNGDQYTSWTDNELVFDGTTLAEIAQLLEDNYGYQVIINDPTIAEKRFKGRAPAGAVENLLQQLEKVFQLDIDTEGSAIEIKPVRVK